MEVTVIQRLLKTPSEYQWGWLCQAIRDNLPNQVYEALDTRLCMRPLMKTGEEVRTILFLTLYQETFLLLDYRANLTSPPIVVPPLIMAVKSDSVVIVDFLLAAQTQSTDSTFAGCLQSVTWMT